jgi:hypothetical protein
VEVRPAAMEQLNPIYVDSPNAVSLDTTPQPAEDGITLPIPSVNQQPLPADLASQRTDKTMKGLGNVIQKSPDEVYQDFLAGKEEMLRQHAASNLDYQHAIDRQKAIQELATKQGGPLDAEQVARIVDPFSPSNTPVDPATVIERAYATNYVSSLNTAAGYMSDSNPITKGNQEIPQKVQDVLDDGSELLTKNQYILKRMQDLQINQVDRQSTVGYIADQAKMLFQPYLEFKERGLIGSAISGIGLGSNLDEAHYTLYKQPLAQFKTTFDTAFDHLAKDNPSLAISYAHSLLSQNTFDAALGNTFSALAIPDAIGLAKGGAKIAKAISTYNQVKRAASDIVQSAARNPNATEATRLEGAGVVGEAAVSRVAGETVAAIEGHADPIAVSQQTLMSTWQTMANDFSANPGTYLSRETYTRLHDGFAKPGEDLYGRINTMYRVERVPVAVASEDVNRAYKDKIRNDFKGPPGMLADVEGPFLEPTSHTYWYKNKLLDYNGEQFSDLETAKGRAEQIGLSNPIIEGESANKVYIPEAAAKTLESVITKNGSTRFFTDGGVEVASSPRPQPGMVPFNLKTEKFEPTLTAESTHIEQQGLGFHIVHWVPLKETDSVIRDTMIKTTSGEAIPEATSTSSATGINNVKNSLLGWVRNSEDTLSINESAQRKAATYAKTNIEQWAHDLNKPVEQLKRTFGMPVDFNGVKVSRKQIYQDFERTLDASRRLDDTGEAGYFFKNPGELQDFYNRNFHRNPSALETEAYFNYVKVKEGERMFAEIAEFRNRAREGYEQVQIKTMDQGKEIKSGFFDGRTLQKFPGGDDFILVMGDQKGGESIYKLGNINTKLKDELVRRTTTGEGKVVEIYDIDHHPLNGFTDVIEDQRIRYVFTEKAETKPLQFNHVNKRGGAHFEWDYDRYLKQADVRPQRVSGKTIENIYVGDKTVMPIKNRALGANVARLWNEAHEFIKRGDWDSVRPLAAKLGIDFQEFSGWYHPGRDANGKPVRAMLDANEPITVVTRGKNINNIDNSLRERYANFKDGTKTGSLNNFKVAYNTERHSDASLRTINDVGTKGNPIFAHQPANFVDPLTTMNRSLNRAMNSMFMDDYKFYGVEHWLREAEPYLEAKGGIKEIRSSPFAHFNEPKFKSDIDYAKKLNLLSNRYKIQSFLGIPSKFDTWVHSFTEHLADAAYVRYGPEETRTIAQKARTIAPIWMLHRLKNPVDFIRGATFNFKLGLFNPAQFLVQAQTHALIWSLEPQHGTAGTYAMLLHGWSRVNKNPAILASLDNYATKLSGFGSRFRPGEFLEAMQELDHSGFAHVAGEYANLSKAYLPTTNFVMNDLTKGLRLGQTPFRLGEQSTRITAFYTAFRKFREENPTTPLTNIERNKILQHADLLTVNMSRASSSSLNHGIFSLSTQFLSYQIKLAELFWSKRIGETATDRMWARARMVLGFSLLYGVPNAVGVTGVPISDFLRQHFMDDLGYIPGEKWASTFINEGLPAWQLAMITGKGDLQKGNVENVGDRFGSQGWQNITQGMRSNIPWWQAIGGASVSTTANFVTAGLDPFYQGALSWLRGDRGDQRFTVRAADLLEPWKQVSTISAGAAWWTALQSGKWLSNNENYITDVSPIRASYLALLGMHPQQQDDMFIKNQMVQGEIEAQKSQTKEFIKDWRRGIQAKEDRDEEQGNAYFRNAMSRMVAVGMPEDKIRSLIAIANKGFESAISRSDYSSWNRGDVSKQQQRLEQYKRQLNLDDKRAQ